MASISIVRHVQYSDTPEPAWVLSLLVNTTTGAPIKPFLVEEFASEVDPAIVWDSTKYRYLRTLLRSELKKYSEDQPIGSIKKGYHKYRTEQVEARYSSYDLAAAAYNAANAAFSSYIIDTDEVSGVLVFRVASAPARVTSSSEAYLLDVILFEGQGGTGEYTVTCSEPSKVTIDGMRVTIDDYPVSNPLVFTCTDSAGETETIEITVSEAPILGSVDEEEISDG